jgi:hypothetical protein
MLTQMTYRCAHFGVELQGERWTCWIYGLVHDNFILETKLSRFIQLLRSFLCSLCLEV